MSPLRLIAFTGAVMLTSPSLAVTQLTLPADIQQEAMTCVGEAAQICPEVWTAQDHGLACMIGKRQAFSPRCRVIYDRVAHALHMTPHDNAMPHGP